MDPLPDIIVGIDVGMTCTGVAYMTRDRARRRLPPQVIQTWPGSTNSSVNKVPTVLTYELPQGVNWERHGESAYQSFPWATAIPSSWGLMEQGNSGFTIDHFKLLLDEKIRRVTFADRPYTEPTALRVRQWFEDFLRLLRRYIGEFLSIDLNGRGYKKVEYIFSIPTTWDQMTAKYFEDAIKLAGFKGEDTSVKMTEAEAAAVCTVQDEASNYKGGDNLIVCDAGGGTTDVSVVQVSYAADESPRFDLLNSVKGEPIGSVQIDEAFAEHVRERLGLINRELPVNTADSMAKGPFQNIKHLFGTNIINLPYILIEVPGLPRDFSDPQARVARGEMKFTRDEIGDMFNIQVARIIGLIDKQIEQFERLYEGDQISALVLSGGLGSSKYVQCCIEDHYRTRALNVLFSSQPQLAVCQGLVMNRVQTTISNHICRYSYGILCNEPYDRKKHAGKGHKHPIDGKLYAINQINWFIFINESMKSSKPQVHPFHRIVEPTELRMKWTDKVVATKSEGTLPQSLDGGGVRVLYEIKSAMNVDLKENDVKQVRKWFDGGRKYWKINNKITASFESVQVKFEILGDGRKINEDNGIVIDRGAITVENNGEDWQEMPVKIEERTWWRIGKLFARR